MARARTKVRARAKKADVRRSTARPVRAKASAPKARRQHKFVASHLTPDAFKADGLQLQYFGYMIGGDKSIIKAECHQRTIRRIVDQLDLRFKNDNACSFRSHQGPGNVEATLRKKFIQVIPGDAPRDQRITSPNALNIAIAYGF